MSENEPVTFNIFGGCVSRDLFPEDTEYVVNQYVSFSSPMSVWKPKGSHTVNMDELGCLPFGKKFVRRCFMLDSNKEGFDYLTAKDSDWLILDFADLRLDLIKYGGDNYTTITDLVIKNPKEFTANFGEYERIPFPTVEEGLKCIEWFGKEILKRYPAEKIILHEYYMCETYLARDGSVKKFDNLEHIRKVNKLLKAVNTRFYEMCGKKCFRITMPDGMVADEKHRWQLYPMHYLQEYYDFAYDAMNLIVNEKKQVPEEMRRKCTKRIEQRLSKIKKIDLSKENARLEFDNKKMRCYALTINNMFKNLRKITNNARTFCEDHNLHHVAFWGDYIISESLKVLLESIGVKLDYIICDWNNHTCDKVIPRTGDYPETDAIIICDVIMPKKRAEFVGMKTDIPVYFLEDIIPVLY